MRMAAVVSRSPPPSLSNRTDSLSCSKTKPSCEVSVGLEDGCDCAATKGGRSNTMKLKKAGTLLRMRVLYPALHRRRLRKSSSCRSTADIRSESQYHSVREAIGL